MIREDFKFKLGGKTLVIIDWANVYGWFSDSKSKNYLGWKIDIKKLFNYLSTYKEIFDKRLYQGIEIDNDRSVNFGEQVKLIGFNFISKEVKFVPVSLDKSHFKTIIKNLFNVLDGIKVANTEISTKLFELKHKIESRLAQDEPNLDSDGNVQGVSPAYTPEDGEIYISVYNLIEELDGELKKLNINITDLQGNLFLPVMRRKCDFDVEIARDVFNLNKDFEHLLLFSGDGDYEALVRDLTIDKNKKVVVVFAPGHVGKEYEKLTKELKEKGLSYRLFMCSADRLKEYISL